MAIDTKNPLYRLYQEVINQGRLEVIDELYNADYVNHIAPFELDKGVAGIKVLFSEFVKAFPDQHITIEDWIQHEEKIVCRWRLTGTHTGNFFGVPPSGKSFVMVGVDVELIKNGRISAHWGGEDMLGLLEQIGAISIPLKFPKF